MVKKAGLLLTVLLLALTLAVPAFAAAPNAWSVGPTPIISPGSRPTVMYDTITGTYHVWYWNNGLYHASGSSLTGLGTGAAVTGVSSDAPFVLKAGDTFYMWAPNSDGSAIDLYTSTDGTNWNFSKQNVFSKGTSGTWYAGKIDNPMVVYDGSEYKMYFQGYQEGATSADARIYQIGLATASSIDGDFTVANGGNPVLTPSQVGEWANGQLFHPWVVKDGDGYHMWFSNKAQTGIGYAHSTDGITWTASTGPVIDTPNAADAKPAVIANGTSWDMIFQQGTNSIAHATGVFSAMATVSFTVGEAGTPEYPPITKIGVQVSDLNLGTITKGTTKTGYLTITNTGDVAETFKCEVTQGPTKTGSTVTVTSTVGPVAKGETGTADVTVTAGSTTGEDSAIITVTATAAQ